MTREGSCEWVHTIDSLDCVDSTVNTCSCGGGGGGRLLEAEESSFHDQALIKATAQINEIIAAIPEDCDGRSLSIIWTKFGPMLAWMVHGDGLIQEGSVTSNNDNATIINALGLKL
jgi:hypothetical protein